MSSELRHATSASVRDFVASMPAHYAGSFDLAEISEHATIVARRGNLIAHVELWQTLQDGSAAICAVADDQPGLLSMISAALVSQRLDVTRAQIYCRKQAAAVLEAVDLFWVRKTTSSGALRPITPADVAAVAEVLGSIITSRTARGAPWVERTLHFDPIPTSRVFFDSKALQRGDCVLVVEAKDSPGLLLSITLALSREEVTIVESEVCTAGHLVRDRFTLVDRYDRPLTSLRMQSIKCSVLTATRGGTAEPELASEGNRRAH